MSPWERGRGEIEGHLGQAELDVVAASADLARRLLDDSERAAESARSLLDADPGSALTLAYDAARKAATSLLAAQGLRPTARGGHRVVQDAVGAQFDGPFERFGRMRRKRHAQQYPDADAAPATREDAEEMIAFAASCLDASRVLLESGQVGAWRE
jgi:HEPN domain-containing protein